MLAAEVIKLVSKNGYAYFPIKVQEKIKLEYIYDTYLDLFRLSLECVHCNNLLKPVQANQHKCII